MPKIGNTETKIGGEAFAYIPTAKAGGFTRILDNGVLAGHGRLFR